MRAQKEFREERDDVVSFWEIDKQLSEDKTQIIEVEVKIKECGISNLETELQEMPAFIESLQEQLKEANKKQLQLIEMVRLAKDLK